MLEDGKAEKYRERDVSDYCAKRERNKKRGRPRNSPPPCWVASTDQRLFLSFLRGVQHNSFRNLYMFVYCVLSPLLLDTRRRREEMDLSITSCLNNFHPFPSSSSKPSPSQASQLTWRGEKERSWKRQCMMGAACVILGLQMEVLPAGEINLAWGMQQESHVASKPSVQRWSDKRSCPPWRLNSLETIVPENLPRPSARRRWEAIGYSGAEAAVPQITRSAANYSTKCFSL